MARSDFDPMGLAPEVMPSSTLTRRAAYLRVDLARKGEGPLHW